MAKKKGQAKGKPTRYQRQQKFWLDGRNKEQNELANVCDDLRKNRRFTPIVRNGLMLMLTLEDGDTTLLFKLFPNLYEQLYAQMEADVMARREDETLNRLNRFEELLNRLSLPSPAPSPQLGTGGPRKLEVKQFALPDDDEDNLTVVAAKVDGNAIANNFLRSLGSIGQGVSEARPTAS